jgi:Tfp pilus assembly protein PilF
VHSMAYVGYCFNKKGAPVAAIPWYERAINEGAISASVYNNLGASYIDARPFLSRNEQFRRAEDHLNQALALDPTSKAVQLNLVRCATFESRLHLDSNPWRVWRIAWSVLKANLANNEVKWEVIAWFRAVNASAPDFLDSAPTSTDEEVARKMFADLILPADRAHDDSAGAKAVANLSSPESHSLPSPNGYFLEPVSITTAR